MLGTKTVYKVVYYDKKEDRRESAYVNKTKVSINYPVGKEVTPEIGKIFAFLRLSDARYFRNHYNVEEPSEVWKAEATGVARFKRHILHHHASIAEYIEDYWSGRRLRGNDLTPPPRGTITCSSIKLIKRS